MNDLRKRNIRRPRQAKNISSQRDCVGASRQKDKAFCQAVFDAYDEHDVDVTLSDLIQPLTHGDYYYDEPIKAAPTARVPLDGRKKFLPIFTTTVIRVPSKHPAECHRFRVS